MPTTLHIGRPIVESLVRHARRDYPQECCGVLLGRRRGEHVHIERAIQADNISEEDRNSTFQVDWQALFAAVRATRRDQVELIGFYHSHPNGSTTPSLRDRETAWPDHSYVIIPAAAESAEIASWRVKAKGAPFEPEQIVLA